MSDACRRVAQREWNRIAAPNDRPHIKQELRRCLLGVAYPVAIGEIAAGVRCLDQVAPIGNPWFRQVSLICQSSSDQSSDHWPANIPGGYPFGELDKGWIPERPDRSRSLNG